MKHSIKLNEETFKRLIDSIVKKVLNEAQAEPEKEKKETPKSNFSTKPSDLDFFGNREKRITMPDETEIEPIEQEEEMEVADIPKDDNPKAKRTPSMRRTDYLTPHETPIETPKVSNYGHKINNQFYPVKQKLFREKGIIKDNYGDTEANTLKIAKIDEFAYYATLYSWVGPNQNGKFVDSFYIYYNNKQIPTKMILTDIYDDKKKTFKGYLYIGSAKYYVKLYCPLLFKFNEQNGAMFSIDGEIDIDVDKGKETSKYLPLNMTEKDETATKNAIIEKLVSTFKYNLDAMTSNFVSSGFDSSATSPLKYKSNIKDSTYYVDPMERENI